MSVDMAVIRRIIEAGVVGKVRFNLDDIEAHIGYARSKWADQFKRETGVTPGDYVRYFRLLSITWDLKRSDATWKEIAEMYQRSESHLHRDFKAAFGMTPIEFRDLSADEAAALRTKIPGQYLRDFE